MQNGITPKSEEKKHQHNRLFLLRPMLRWVARLRSSPSAIAGGLAMGTFVAFTPTMGVQFIAVVVLATILSLNRPAAIVPIWITNPVTVAPIYTFNYWIGTQFCDGPPLQQVSGIFVDMGKAMANMELWQIKEQAEMMLHLGKGVIIPLIAGSCLIGTVLGLIVYIVALKLLEVLFARKKRRQHLSILHKESAKKHMNKNKKMPLP